MSYSRGWPFLLPQPAEEPKPPTIADSEHYCPTPDCDSSWWGPAPCWLCGAEGISRIELPAGARVTWQWTNQYRQPAEGEVPA